MMTSAKGHFGVYHDFVRKFRFRLMKGSAYKNFVCYLYRLKIAFPHFVPILLRDQVHLVAKFKHILVISDCLIYPILVKIRFRNIGFKTAIYLFKSIKTYFAQSVDQ